MPHILIVDDEPRLRAMLEALFEAEGYRTAVARDGAEALQAVREATPDVVLSDIRMPGLDGRELLREIVADHPGLPLILMTAHDTDMASAVQAMREGAYHYVAKPFDNDELLMTVDRALRSRALQRENRGLRRRVGLEEFTFDTIVGQKSPAMKRALDLAQKGAPEDATILLRGESGTGKEVFAQAIHGASRPRGPFVGINCGAIPEDLLESELFGHEKGAFTGADSVKEGLFETAHDGTIFLDEIGEMAPKLQVKLLRVLETRSFTRVGSTRPIGVDVRVIAATNRDLREAVENGVFREDLLYRLDVFGIDLPPLRDRREDLSDLLGHFLSARGRSVDEIAAPAMARLGEHRWPGNVRELHNVVVRACILAGDGPIDLDCLPDHLGSGTAPMFSIEIPDEGLELREVEKDLIRKALRKAAGNKSQAATLLGITRRTLYSKLEKYGDLS